MFSGCCLCGKSKYAAASEPRFSIQCYCRDCQHVSGGGNLPQLAMPKDTFSYSGEIKTYQGKSASGNDLEFSFCSDCGSPMFKTTSMAPELVFVYAGSLDDPTQFADPQKVYEDARQPWDKS
ncbi:GFA family protein [Roseibium sediminicola]|uniref:GFA family protein n=1 Tax=Roseibium sediminicola TaxID=2933272 RepID=UPI003CE57492